jgi:hypothetical protein
MKVTNSGPTMKRSQRTPCLCVAPIDDDDAGDIEFIAKQVYCRSVSPDDMAGMVYVCALQPPSMAVFCSRIHAAVAHYSHILYNP